MVEYGFSKMPKSNLGRNDVEVNNKKNNAVRHNIFDSDFRLLLKSHETTNNIQNIKNGSSMFNAKRCKIDKNLENEVLFKINRL